MCMECCQGRSPFSQLRKDAFQKGAILTEAISKWFNGSVLNLLVLKDRADLSLSSLVLELATSTLVVTLSRVSEWSLFPVGLCLLESVGQDFKLGPLQLLLSILFLVTFGTDVIRDVINLVFDESALPPPELSPKEIDSHVLGLFWWISIIWKG